jgi:hypothetical protein
VWCGVTKELNQAIVGVGSRLVGRSGERSESSDEGARGVRVGVEMREGACFWGGTNE